MVTDQEVAVQHEQAGLSILEDVVSQVEEEIAAGDESPGEVTLSNGIVLSLKPVPPLYMRQVMADIKEPQPPSVWNESAQRNEINTKDPEYFKEYLEYLRKTEDRAISVLLALGTAVKSVPDGVQQPDADEWLDAVEFGGIEVKRDSSRHRYLAWLRYYALVTNEDVARVFVRVGALTGLKKQAVVRAIRAAVPGLTPSQEQQEPLQPIDTSTEIPS